MKKRGWVLRGALLLCSFSFIGAKGCVFDGDASLGSDSPGSAGEPDENAQAGSGETGGSATGSAGKPMSSGNAGMGNNAGMSSGGGASASGGSGSASGGSEPGAAGEPSGGGEPSTGSAQCQQPLDSGPCDAAIPTWGYDTEQSQCVKFIFGGCEGNSNRFMTREACEDRCVDLTCPSHLQTDTVYFVMPLNRPERACIDLDNPVHVTCSLLLNPSETVPTGWSQSRCAKREGNTFYAGTTLPKAEGWTDCSAQEADLVDHAPPCSALK
jgi:hypothetical protein